VSNLLKILPVVNSKLGIRWALWLYEDERKIFYCIRTAEKSEPKSEKNYRETEDNNHITFKIIRDLFIINDDFAFDIQWGANLH